MTATTIYCDAVDDDITIMVYKDRTARCAGYRKYLDSATRETLKELQQKSRKLKRQLEYEGPLEHRVTEYHDRVFAGEAGRT